MIIYIVLSQTYICLILLIDYFTRTIYIHDNANQLPKKPIPLLTLMSVATTILNSGNDIMQIVTFKIWTAIHMTKVMY